MIYHVQIGMYVEADDEQDLWERVRPIAQECDKLDAEGESAYDVVETFERIEDAPYYPIESR